MTRWLRSHDLLLVSAGLAAAGCGGKVVIDPLGEGGAGASGVGGAPTTTTTTTTTGTGGAGTGGAGGGPGSPTLIEVPIGELPTGGVATFEIPDGTLGFTAIVKPPGQFDNVGVEHLIAPSGYAVIADYSLPPTDWTFAWYGMTVAAVPQSDAPPAMPAVMTGPWQIAIGDPTGAPGSGEVSVWLRRTADGEFHGGTLDVNVFIAGGVTTPQYMADMVLESYEGYAGLKAGTATFYELGAEWAVVSDAVQFFEVLEQTAAATSRPALNVIAIADLTGELDGAAGVAAGIPGQGVEH
jgi:hypothetical protein